jgi:hypothetical protein
MNRSALLLGFGAGLLFAAGTANAGACSAEIEALQKTIASIGTVAGGATDQPNANASAASQAEGSTDTGTPGGTVPAPGEIPVPAAKTGQTAAKTGQTAAAGTEPVPAPNGTDATGGMVADAGNGIAGGAGGVPAETAPQDSVVPQAGQPTSAATGAQPDPDAASQSLARAQLLDQAGDEPGCMKEVSQAKSQLGQL